MDGVSYRRVPGVTTQQDIRLHGRSVVDAITTGALGDDASQTVMLLGHGTAIYELNVPGAVLWELLERPATRNDCADALTAAFRGTEWEAAGQDAATWLMQ